MKANDLPGGWIYVMLTSEDYTRSKIGRTSGNPLVRFRTLRTSEPFLGLVVAYYIPNYFGPASAFEASIHAEFEDQRIYGHDEAKSEWFRIEYSQAEMLIDGMLEDWCNQRVQYFGDLRLDQLCKLYESDIRACFERDPDDVDFARSLLGGPSG